MKSYDIGIIGGGPAGYTAGIHAGRLGLKAVLFEKDKLGGVCLNKGCIPTKTILHSAEVYEELKCADELGISCSLNAINFGKVMERKNKTVEKIRKSLELAVKNSGIDVIYAEAQIIDSRNIKAENEIYECKKIICAAGSHPKEIKGLEFDHKFILNSDDILNLTELPKSVLIVGSGAIGTEWARIFAAFDVDVTVVELADKLLPQADNEVSKRIERIFKKTGIKFYTTVSVKKIKDRLVELSNGNILNPELILSAAGRSPETNERIDGVTYLGDICGEIQLAHFAVKQALTDICGLKFNKNLVPFVVYGCPEIAWAGKREQDLEEGTFQKSTFLISALGKSHCDNCTDGFIKILSHDNKIIGAHIVSKEASALIQQVIIAMQNDIGADKLKEVCFAHPTYSEGIFECLFGLS